MSYTPYNPNIPEKPGNSFAISQPQLLNNFMVLFDAFQKNHVSLNAMSGAGNHTIVQLAEQENAQQTGVSEINVYAKDVSEQTGDKSEQGDQVYLRYQGNGQEIQYTNYQIYSVNANNFFTFLPGKSIVYFGQFPANTRQLPLTPPIAVSIVSISFCPIGTANYKPWAGVLNNPAGFFNAITINSANPINTTVPACYYMVWANI